MIFYNLRRDTVTLTSKQQQVLDYIKGFFGEQGMAPTYQEIQGHFGFKSLGSVVDYVNYLKKAGYVTTNSNATRNLELVEQSEPNMLIPLLGKVAAGSPLTLMNDRDYANNISVPQSMVTSGECFALEVEGESMIEDGIFDGDYVVIKSQKTARNGQTVVALVNGAATIKTFWKKQNKIELHPANSSLKPILVSPDQDFQVQGVLVALMRNYLG